MPSGKWCERGGGVVFVDCQPARRATRLFGTLDEPTREWCDCVNQLFHRLGWKPGGRTDDAYFFLTSSSTAVATSDEAESPFGITDASVWMA